MWTTSSTRKWILLILIVALQMVLFHAEETQGGLKLSTKKNERAKMKQKGNKKLQSLSKQKLKKISKAMKIYMGQAYTDPSMCLFMGFDSSEWYTWYYEASYGASSALVASDQCVITRANEFLDTSDTPPTPDINSPEAYIAYCPRSGCDRAFHAIQLFLSSDTPFDGDTYQNNLAIWKMKYSMPLGEPVCGEMPIYAAPVSCDRNGPPDGYEDCYLSGWGKVNDTQTEPAPNIFPTRTKVVVLSFDQCEAIRLLNDDDSDYAMNPNTEVCVTNFDGLDPTCDYDFNAPLMCKYWNPVEQNGGWGWNQNQGNGWGQNTQTEQRYVVVGQRTYTYGDTSCDPGPDEITALRVLRFGAKAYSSLFGQCNMVCSDDLPPGYECKEKWNAGVGPVYCTPQKIRPYHPSSSHGWKQ